MYKQLSINGLKNWYLKSVFNPILLSLGIMIIGQYIVAASASYILKVFELSLILAVAILINLVFSGLQVFKRIIWKNIL